MKWKPRIHEELRGAMAHRLQNSAIAITVAATKAIGRKLLTCRPWINVDAKLSCPRTAIGVPITKSALTARFGFLVPVFQHMGDLPAELATFFLTGNPTCREWFKQRS